MASNIREIIEGQLLGNSAATLYTSPTGVFTQILKLTCCNIDTASHAVTIYLVTSGSSVGNAFYTTRGQAIQPGQTWNSPNEYGLVLAPGDFLAALADTGNVVNIAASGVQLT
jgi:hypothetical protein